MAKLPNYIRLMKINSTDKCTLKTLKKIISELNPKKTRIVFRRLNIMSKLPEYILVVVCKYSKSDKDVTEILKECFSGLPHIIYTHPSLDSKDTYYMLPYTHTFRDILGNIDKKLHNDLLDSLGFVVYDRTINSHITYDKNFDREIYSSRRMPLFIRLSHTDIQNLISLT